MVVVADLFVHVGGWYETRPSCRQGRTDQKFTSKLRALPLPVDLVLMHTLVLLVYTKLSVSPEDLHVTLASLQTSSSHDEHGCRL